MQPWRVSDVMTAPVITTAEDTPLRELAGILTSRRLSAVPIVGHDERPVGLVSEADLLATLAPRKTRATRAAAAVDVMSKPVLSIAPDAPLSEAATKMRAKNVKRLLVTDGSGRLVGIVSRADLLRPYSRSDAAIRQDVTDRVLRRTLWIDSSQVRADVYAGVVTLTGTVGRRTTAAIATRLTAQIPGVVRVVNEIRDSFDDTALARSRIHKTHPFSAEPFRP
ncbi:CBS domain-containing protein [Paractinoplanes toevensis]|uniref:CBS domain-containing protein n=1 Tax=Paractinoplanes toevensis TaxID=571911 RepID=A0A919T8K7_9ACTN|nr:CBS domain-containing protein [Actinoplanes toevensis]GIM89860.1 hypothetical protein Ato02nite_016530 [Actinoplanes toevensis]